MPLNIGVAAKPIQKALFGSQEGLADYSCRISAVLRFS